jgi:hypothetical protein
MNPNQPLTPPGSQVPPQPILPQQQMPAQPQMMPPMGMPMPQQQMPPGMPGGRPPMPAPRANPTSTQNALEIAEIRDGIVIMNDGSFRAVVMCQSINFDLMSPEEREAVEFSYQGFLNSLYFPIQVFVRSQKVDLRPYIDKLDKIRSEHDNMLLALLMEDYIGFMDAISQQTNIMDKKFYLVIPFEPLIDAQKVVQASKGFFNTIFGKKELKVVINEATLEKAKTELKNRIQAVMNGLQQCQVQSLPLDTQELIELYYDAYNPDTATRQKLKNFGKLEMDAPVVTRGEGLAPTPNLDKELYS